MYQSDFIGTNASIAKSGCYFLSILWCCGIRSKDRIGKIYDDAVALEVIQPDCYVLDPQGLFSLGGVEVERRPAWSAQPDGDFNIAEYRYAGASHFVVVDGESQTIWDPYSKAGSLSVLNGTIGSYRTFTRRV